MNQLLKAAGIGVVLGLAGYGALALYVRWEIGRS
jgi:hypothetical protein